MRNREQCEDALRAARIRHASAKLLAAGAGTQRTAMRRSTTASIEEVTSHSIAAPGGAAMIQRRVARVQASQLQAILDLLASDAQTSVCLM